MCGYMCIYCVVNHQKLVVCWCFTEQLIIKSYWAFTKSNSGYLDFYSCTKCHFKFSFRILWEHSLEGLFEQRCVEWVTHHHMSTASKTCANLYKINIWIISTKFSSLSKSSTVIVIGLCTKLMRCEGIKMSCTTEKSIVFENLSC